MSRKNWMGRMLRHPGMLGSLLLDKVYGHFIDDPAVRQFQRSRYALICYPKCGRTWVQVVMGALIHDVYNLHDIDLKMLTYEQTRYVGMPRLTITHDGSGPPYRDYYPPSKRYYHDKRVILIIRDVRDVMVSYYYHCTRRERLFEGTLSQFIHDHAFGMPRLMPFLQAWYENRNTPEKLLLVRYEDMQLNKVATFRAVADFMEIRGVTDLSVKKAIEFGSFDRMREMERSGEYRDAHLGPTNTHDPEAFKLRRGKIGSYAEVMSAEDLAYISEQVAACKLPREWVYANTNPS